VPQATASKSTRLTHVPTTFMIVGEIGKRHLFQ
jgi:hypothetical protein